MTLCVLIIASEEGVYLIIVLFLLLLLRYMLCRGFCCQVFFSGMREWDVSDVLSFCGASGVTSAESTSKKLGAFSESGTLPNSHAP